MSSSLPPVLVTGGAGYIGSHTCKSLAAKGYLPICYDNLVFGHEWAVRWGPFEYGDVLDYERLVGVMRQYQPIAVIHFAAFAYVGESIQDPSKYYRNNFVGSLTLLEAMRDVGIRNLVFSSTCATYGVPDAIPIDESAIQKPINPYGRSKLMIEQMLQDFDSAYGLNSIALRYFNACGADPEAEIGELHDPEPHLIPLVLDAAMGQRDSIEVYGNDYDTADGTCVRDYVHVTDLAEAHVLALKCIEQAEGFRAYNLSNGAGFSVMEIIEAVRELTNRDIVIRNSERRAGDPPTLIGDSRKAEVELDWQPRFSSLNQILSTALAWHGKLFE